MKENTVEENDSVGLSGAEVPDGAAPQEHSAIVPEPAMNAAPVRVLIADKSERLRQRIRAMFAHEPEFNVVGEITLPHDLTTACVNLSPDILVLGLGGRGDGPYVLSALAALRRTVDAVPRVGAIVLVSCEKPEEFLQTLRAGARCVLLRDVPKRTLLDAVGDVMAGGAALDRRLISTIFEYLADSAGSGAHDAPRPVDPIVRRALSPREQEVLYSLARGHSSEEIAAQLCVSVGTVKTHLGHIYRKLEVRNRTSAVLKAFQLRLPEAA